MHKSKLFGSINFIQTVINLESLPTIKHEGEVREC